MKKIEKRKETCFHLWFIVRVATIDKELCVQKMFETNHSTLDYSTLKTLRIFFDIEKKRIDIIQKFV